MFGPLTQSPSPREIDSTLKDPPSVSKSATYHAMLNALAIYTCMTSKIKQPTPTVPPADPKISADLIPHENPPADAHLF